MRRAGPGERRGAARRGSLLCLQFSRRTPPKRAPVGPCGRDRRRRALRVIDHPSARPAGTFGRGCFLRRPGDVRRSRRRAGHRLWSRAALASARRPRAGLGCGALSCRVGAPGDPAAAHRPGLTRQKLPSPQARVSPRPRGPGPPPLPRAAGRPARRVTSSTPSTSHAAPASLAGRLEPAGSPPCPAAWLRDGSSGRAPFGTRNRTRRRHRHRASTCAHRPRDNPPGAKVGARPRSLIDIRRPGP